MLHYHLPLLHCHQQKPDKAATRLPPPASQEGNRKKEKGV